MVRIGIVLAAAFAAAPLAARPATLPRTELPIREVDSSSGARRYIVTISVAGQSIDAGLDTGSTGLRILPRAMPAGQGGDRTHYGYSSGIGFDGRITRVPLAFGAVSGEARVMRVEQVACERPQAQCANNPKPDIATFGIFGDGVPGQGFVAVLGIGLKSDPVDNPLEQLGVRRWIVELPRPGDTQPGRLILNPADDEVADYVRIKFSDDGNEIDGCLEGASAKGKICAGTVFDTGAPGIRLMGMRGTPWPQGTTANIILRDGTHQAEMPIVIGRRELASAMFIQPGSEQRPQPRISLGIAPYFHWSVLYDAGEHRIGLRDR